MPSNRVLGSYAPRGDVVVEQADARPLVLHVVYSFDVGGLENGIVNLINCMPAGSYRHAVLALTQVVPQFSRRIERVDVEFVSLRKPPGHALSLYPRLYRLFRRMQPAVVHTRNLAALETQVPAWVAGVPVRIHGEHGRDVGDLDGSSRRYQWMRRAYRPFVGHYVALSRDLADYLSETVGVPQRRITQVYNGVDTEHFKPRDTLRAALAGSPFNDPSLWVVGTVGRMQAVKAQTLLARAFVNALQRQPRLRARLRLIMVGDGPLRGAAQAILDEAGFGGLAWLPGERHDVPDVMRTLDCFVLPSLAEGISNTILEAMATGLPVLATDVGGNADLVAHDRTGLLSPAADVDALTAGLVQLAENPEAAIAMGHAGRAEVERRFSLQSMVDSYQGIYDRQLSRHNFKPKPG